MKKVITKADYIRQSSDEELAKIIDNWEETLIAPTCNEKHCEHFSEDGTCDYKKENKCIAAILHWLHSPVEVGKPWYE